MPTKKSSPNEGSWQPGRVDRSCAIIFSNSFTLSRQCYTRRRFSSLRLTHGLHKQRAHPFRFLYVDKLDATNNQADACSGRPSHVHRAWRSACAGVVRKTNGCNRTARGARAYSIVASVLVTCRQQGVSLLDALVKLQRATNINFATL